MYTFKSPLVPLYKSFFTWILASLFGFKSTLEIFKADKFFRTVSIKSTVFNSLLKTVLLIEKQVRERSNVQYA